MKFMRPRDAAVYYGSSETKVRYEIKHKISRIRDLDNNIEVQVSDLRTKRQFPKDLAKYYLSFDNNRGLLVMSADRFPHGESQTTINYREEFKTFFQVFLGRELYMSEDPMHYEGELAYVHPALYCELFNLPYSTFNKYIHQTQCLHLPYNTSLKALKEANEVLMALPPIYQRQKVSEYIAAGAYVNVNEVWNK